MRTNARSTGDGHGALIQALCLALILMSGSAVAVWCAPSQEEAGGGDVETQLRLAEALRELERNEEAIEAFRQVLAVAPDDFEARLSLGALLVEEREWEAAREHLTRAMDLRPEDPRAVYQLAEAQRGLQRWSEALSGYEKAMALDPSDENSRIGQAEALVALGRFAEARAQLEAGRELFPESRGLKFGLAWLLGASPDGALRDGERALELAQALFNERRSIGAAELIAAAQAELGHCEEAVGLQNFVLEQAVLFERPPEVMARLELAASWYAAEPCRTPDGRPAGERPEWPRRRSM